MKNVRFAGIQNNIREEITMFYIRNRQDKTQIRQVSRGQNSDEFDSGYCYRSDFHLFDSEEWEIVNVKLTARQKQFKITTHNH
jgi:hypothetical protein